MAHLNNILLPSTEEEIIDIPPEKRIFVFWQCLPGKSVPGYITLCLQTLVNFNPDHKIIFLNYENIYILLGDVIDWNKFIHLKMMHQSDILKAHFCVKYGGSFIDADTIYTGSIEWLNSFSNDTLVGTARTRNRMQFGFLSIKNKKNFLLWHVREMQSNRITMTPIENLTECSWDYFSCAIVDPMIEFDFWRDDKIITLLPIETISLERSFDYPGKVTSVAREELYRNFWFGNLDFSISDLISFAKYNVIILHNSWTEDLTNNMSASEFIEKNYTMAKLFRVLLNCEKIDESQLIKIPYCGYVLKKKL